MDIPDDLFEPKKPALRKRKHSDEDEDREVQKRAAADVSGAQTRSVAPKAVVETTLVPTAAPTQPDGADIVRQYTACKHEVAYPPGYDLAAAAAERAANPPPLRKKAREYPFVLDDFQKKSIDCLENNESVLVSAHTSAGKTVVAEYAIAMALRDAQRVIYTSPIKALSNQKYRDLQEQFGDVGLMTGDVTISPSASCLVMTTEILRSMLYRGSEILREIAYVIFDEIHYMRDKERGVVWEETIILLPENCRFVFLSATIPNALEFAGWISKMKSQPCNVVYTDYRPTPLQHYLFPSGSDGLHLVVDEKGEFREDNFNKALMALSMQEGADSGKGKKNAMKTSGSDLYKIVKMVMERNYDPVIVFSFSKRECEAYAMQMTKLEFNTDDEKKLVETVFMNAIDSLSDDDKRLPQVENVLPLLKRGIGIHHSGLLPILKEVIEILFQEGLIKCLFATETFAMGINMPAKTVVFTSVRKFDGENFRWVTSGEYIQMSGRAGRRGLDDRGIVIMMINEKMEPSVAKSMVYGHADSLNSTFHLGYNMLLNLLRVEDANPEYIIKNSFHQYQSERACPEMLKAAKELETERDAIVIREETAVTEYYHVRGQLSRLHSAMKDVMQKPIYCLPFLQPGRIIKVGDEETDWGLGVVVNFQKKSGSTEKNQTYIVDVLVSCEPKQARNMPPIPSVTKLKGDMQVVPFKLSLIDGITSVRVYIPKDLRSADNRQSVCKTLVEVQARFKKDGLPLLDPVEDMLIEDDTFRKAAQKAESLESRLSSNSLFQADDLDERYDLYKHKQKLIGDIKLLHKQAKAAQSMVMKDELKHMKRVLRRLGYTTDENVIDVKGRVACEISTADELLTTELIFNGVFNDLTVEQTVALVSVLVSAEKSDDAVKMKDELGGPLRMLQEAARRIARISQESKIAIDQDEYVQSFKPNMMDIVFAWCNGAKFFEICKMTDIFEGSIIRAMRRLEELLRQLCAASKAIGDTDLENKFAEGIAKIKRDIVFAASLYL